MKKESSTKILFVITKSNWGGAQRYVYDLATHLPEGYEAVVALGGTGLRGAEPGALKERLEASGVRTRVVRHFMRDMSLFDDLCAFFELWWIVLTERPRVLHVTSSKAGGLGVMVGRLSFVHRIVFASHGLTFDEAWRPWWHKELIRAFTWLTILLSSRTIMATEDTYDRTRRMPLVGSKVRLVPYGIELSPLVSRDEARHALLPNAKEAIHAFTWIGCIAEYHPNKNLGLLVEATALLRHRGTPVQLVLIGDGESREHLETLARERTVHDYVHCTGHVQNAAQYLHAFDMFSLPSQKEGLPYVLIEAGMAELPVVVSDIPGNKAVVTHEKTGLVVEPTPVALAAAFARLLEHPDERATFAKALHADVTRRFSISRMVQDTLAVYE